MIAEIYNDVSLLTFIALLASLTTRFWFMLLGYPNPDLPKGIQGQEVFYKDMIFSFLGVQFARLKSRFNHLRINPFKILVCEICFNVWVCFLLCFLSDLRHFNYLVVPIISYTFQSILSKYVEVSE